MTIEQSHMDLSNIQTPLPYIIGRRGRQLVAVIDSL